MLSQTRYKKSVTKFFFTKVNDMCQHTMVALVASQLLMVGISLIMILIGGIGV